MGIIAFIYLVIGLFLASGGCYNWHPFIYRENDKPLRLVKQIIFMLLWPLFVLTAD